MSAKPEPAKPQREFTQRVEDKGAAAVAAVTVKAASRTFWQWVQDNQIDSFAVLIVTLWITTDVMRWATGFANVHSNEGMQVPAIIGAVLAPWGLLQAAMVKWYMELKGKPNGNGGGK